MTTGGPRGTGEALRAATAVLGGALVGSVLQGLANVGWLAGTKSVARVRDDLEIFVAARRVLSVAGFELLRWAPVPLSHPMEMSAPGEAARLTALAVVTAAALSLPIALAAAALAAAFLRGRFARAIAPLAAAAFFAPALYAPVRRLMPAWVPIPAPNLVAWLALAAVLGGLVLLALRRAAPSRAFRLTVAGIAAAVLLASMAGAARVGPRAGTPDGGRPNVLLISIDSLRADHVGCYGYEFPTTPTLDRLASEGARFRRASAPSSWTLPSHLSLLTGLPVESPPGDPAGLRAGLSTRTLAEVLRSAGYSTAGLVGGTYLESRYGFAQGFSVYDDFTVAAATDDESAHGVTSPALLDLATDWLRGWRRSGGNRPFFLFWHLWDVHFDYAPPPPFDRKFDPDYRGSLDGDFSNPAFRPGMDERDLRHVVALYDGEIAFTDEHIGKLIATLEEWGVLDDTLVVVVSDHGDEFFEHGAKGHQRNLYDTTLHVPWIVRWPGRIPAGLVVEEDAGLLDVAPTILSLVEAEAPPDFARVVPFGDPVSRDLSPLLEGTGPPSAGRRTKRPIFADLFGTLGAVRASGHKLIARFDDTAREKGPELYDLDADPGERTNLAAARSEIRTELESMLLDWRRLLAGRTLSGDVPKDAKHRERLRALGYVD